MEDIMSRKFNEATVAFAILAYPYFSNVYLSKYIGCSKVWLEKIGQKYKVKKAGLFNLGKLDGCQQENIIGVSFGDLLVIDKLPHKVKNNIVWKCQCKCGFIQNIRSTVLRNGLRQCVKCRKNKPKEKHKKFSLENKQRNWFWSKVRSHAFERGIDVEIDFDYILDLFKKQNGQCALTGIDIEFPYIKDHRKHGNGSLDRIDSSKGYVEGNVRWVLKDINLMRNNHSDQTFIDLCCNVADYYRNNANGGTECVTKQ